MGASLRRIGARGVGACEAEGRRQPATKVRPGEVHRRAVHEVPGVVMALDPVPALEETSEGLLSDIGAELLVTDDECSGSCDAGEADASGAASASGTWEGADADIAAP